MNLFVLSLLLIVLFVTVTNAEEEKPAAVKKTTAKKSSENKWNKINLTAVEEELEAGDDKEELESEYDRLQRVQQKHMPKFDTKDPASMKRAYRKNPSTFGNGQGNVGHAMVFVDVLKADKNGKPYVKKDMEKLASKWTSLLQSGGLLTQIYVPGDNMILVNIERGWLTNDIMKFIAEQPEVEFLTLNQKKFTTKEYLKHYRKLQEDDDDEL
jgi:hypothetical protein